MTFRTVDIIHAHEVRGRRIYGRSVGSIPAQCCTGAMSSSYPTIQLGDIPGHHERKFFILSENARCQSCASVTTDLALVIALLIARRYTSVKLRVYLLTAVPLFRQISGGHQALLRRVHYGPEPHLYTSSCSSQRRYG